jgi:hypothetical protein
MSNDTYNGWTNYETWRVNLEVFDGFDPSEYFSAYDPEDVYELGQSLKQYAEEVIFDCGQVPDGLAADYARAFLSDVNWYEIAKHMAANYPAEIEEAA